MSSLYLQGLKQGDTQMTAIGLITAGMFYFISTVKPLTHLSETKPPQSVFAFSVLLSIFGQFIVHIISLLLVLSLCHYSAQLQSNITEHVDRPIADSKFHPNLVNTTVYFLYATIQLNNFFVNYRGYPFTQDVTENIPFCRSLQGVYLILILLLTGIFEPLNDFLQLVLLPSTTFQYLLALILIGDLVFSYIIEKFCQKFE